MNPFKVLGLPTNASIEAAKKAYRALRTKHHPDHGGDGKQFQEIKEAWETIESGHKDLNEQFRCYPRSPFKGFQGPSNDHEITVLVGLKKAFTGFCVAVPGANGQSTVQVPPGTPNGYSGKYRADDGSEAIVTTRINEPPFFVRGFNQSDVWFQSTVGLSIGDVEVDFEVDAIDLITGTWILIKDFLGEKLKVRVPAGFDPNLRIKIAGKGYCGWNFSTDCIDPRRQDMYIKLRPKFKKPADIDPQKIANLYNAVHK